MDGRLTCVSPIESKYYAMKPQQPLICHHCGVVLGEAEITKFEQTRLKFNIVLPACDGDCAALPSEGWVTKKPKRVGIQYAKKAKKNRKRKIVSLDIDLQTFVPRRIEDGIEDWLADSKPAWNQLLYKLKVQRRLKKKRQ